MRSALRAERIVYLTVTSSDESTFRVRFAIGAGSGVFDDFTGTTEIGLAGYVKRSGRSQWLADYLTAPEIVHSPAVDAPMLAEGIVSMLGIPLVAGERFLGTLNVAHRVRRPFTAAEISLLEAFADHAAIALENARLRDEHASTLATLRQAYSTIETEVLRHDALGRLVLTEADVATVADWLACELDGDVVIVSRAGAPQSRHGSDAHASPDPAQSRLSTFQTALLDASAAAGRCTVGRHPNGPSVSAIALVAEGAIRGGFLLERAHELSQTEIRTFEHAAHIATLLSLSQEAVADAEARARGDLLSQVLDARVPFSRALVLRAATQGIDLELSNVLAVLDVNPAVLERVARALAAYARGVNGLSGVDRGHPVILLAADDIDVAVTAIHAHLSRTMPTERVVVCGTAVGVGGAGFDQILTVARRGAAVLAAMGVHDAAVSAERLAPFMVLLDPLRTAELDSFTRAAIGPLLDYDAQRGAHLVDTLARYYSCSENLTRTASELHIHVNTLQKRVDRIGELLGPRWRDPERALTQNLASRLVVLKRELVARYRRSGVR